METPFRALHANRFKIMSDKPIALDAYETLAEAYAAVVETKPHNAYYERPATLSLLPDVKGKKVFDAGCGPGIYSQWLIKNGANVTAVDASPKMIELAKQRLGENADVRLADMSKPLDFLESANFDIVLSPLVLDYIENWYSVFGEFYRLLRPSGYFIFSVTHPFFDYIYYKTDNYFRTELVGSEWRGFDKVRVEMPSFRRPLNELLNPLLETGFQLEKIIEPLPKDEFKTADPKHYEELSKFPAFLCVRARK
jgi:SAM-dependent methyltransferase